MPFRSPLFTHQRQRLRPRPPCLVAMPCCQRRQLNSQGEDWQNLFRHVRDPSHTGVPRVASFDVSLASILVRRGRRRLHPDRRPEEDGTRKRQGVRTFNGPGR